MTIIKTNYKFWGSIIEIEQVKGVQMLATQFIPEYSLSCCCRVFSTPHSKAPAPHNVDQNKYFQQSLHLCDMG